MCVRVCVFLCSSDPLEAPLNVGVVLLNSTAIRVVWAPVDKETVRGHLIGYKVLHRCATKSLQPLKSHLDSDAYRDKSIAQEP